MASKFEQFVPTADWVHEQAFDTLLVHLPGFQKDHLTVQITSNRKLRVMGERQNVDRWDQFRREIPIPSHLDTTKVSARFDSGTLYVKFPKVIAPAEQQTKPPTTSSAAPKPTTEPQAKKKDQQQKTDASPKAGQPDKSTMPKQGDPTPKKKLEDDKEVKEGGAPKDTLDEEKKQKVSKMPDKGKKPELPKTDDAAQIGEAELVRSPKVDAAEFSKHGPSDKKPELPKADDAAHIREAGEEKSPKVDAAEFSKRGPSDKKGAPAEKPSGQEAEERRKNHRRRGRRGPEKYEKFTGGFIERMKQPGNLTNSIVVALLILMLAVYLKYKYAFKSHEGRHSIDSLNPQV